MTTDVMNASRSRAADHAGVRAVVRPTSRLNFRAMGTDAEIIVVGHRTGDARTVAEQARVRVDQLEQRWSRFLPDSEVSRLNRGAGAPVTVSEDTVELIRMAGAAWRLTGGSVDATVLGAMLRAGYDRSFDELDRSCEDESPGAASALLLGCDDIEIDGNRVRLPTGTGFDPGGIGKGLAADMVAVEAMEAGVAGVCVNLGGDLRVIGTAPGGDGWTIAIEHPRAEAPLTHVGLRDGAVATSTTLLRRWSVDGEERHHLIEPATGRPSGTDLTSVTLIAGTAWAAEVLAKAVLLRGSCHPFDLIGGLDVEALAVDDRGHIVTSPGFLAYTGSAPVPATVRRSSLRTPTAVLGAATERDLP